MKRNNSLQAVFLRVLMLAIVGLLGVGQFQRFELSQQVFVYLHEVLMGVGILFSLRLIIPMFKTLWKFTWVRWFAGFLCITIVSLLLAYTTLGFNYWMVGVMYFLRLVLYILFGVMCMALVRGGVIKKHDMLVLLLVPTTCIAVFGILQYLFIPDVRGLKLLGWDDHYLRIVSTLFDPAFTGLILVFGFIVSGYTWFISRKKLPAVLSVLYLIALLFTYSRASYLALGIALVYMALQMKRLRIYLLIFGVLVAVGILILPRPASEGARLERIKSVEARVTGTARAISELSTRSLVIGNGWYLTNSQRKINNTITDISHSSTPDNSLLHVLQSTGVFGLITFLAAGVMIFRSTKSLIVRSVLVALFVSSFFNQTIFYPWVMAYLGLLLAYNLDATR